jgi:hypothetical protein
MGSYRYRFAAHAEFAKSIKRGPRQPESPRPANHLEYGHRRMIFLPRRDECYDDRGGRRHQADHGDEDERGAAAPDAAFCHRYSARQPDGSPEEYGEQSHNIDLARCYGAA